MKILHLFSNWKWTGPAEPALNLSLSLKKRGHDVTFACGTATKGNTNYVATKAMERGITPVTAFKLKKHFNVINNLRDISHVKQFIKKNRYDIVHTHMPNDHLIGGKAARGCGHEVLVVRTDYSGIEPTDSLRNRYLLKNLTDGLLVVSDKSLKGNMATFNLKRETVQKIDGAIDLNRFDPANSKQDLQNSLGIKEDDVVVGIVARVQRHRQFDLLLHAISIAVKEYANLKLLIIGRGTNINEIAVERSSEMNIDNNVIFAGYRKDDFVDVLACMDINVFLVPGSDGSCRAVREVMAMGKPVITLPNGMLPEMVINGETGFIVNDNAPDMADAFLKLTQNKQLREKLGMAAREKAVNDFNLDRQSEIVEKFYYSLIEQRSSL